MGSFKRSCLSHVSLTQEVLKSLNSIKVLLHGNLDTFAYILYYLDLSDKRFLMPIKKNDALEEKQVEIRGTSEILFHFSLILRKFVSRNSRYKEISRRII